MNNKIHLSDLAIELAKHAQKEEELTEGFLRELFALIEEALIEEQVVKIKAIGTFKLQLVNARRIANIQTGETQEVPEYYKVVFTPDKRLASLVNEPYRHLSSVEILENGEFKMIESNKEELDDLAENASDEPNLPDSEEDTYPKSAQLDELKQPQKAEEKEEKEPTIVVKAPTKVHHDPIILPKMNVETLAQLYKEEDPEAEVVPEIIPDKEETAPEQPLLEEEQQTIEEATSAVEPTVSKAPETPIVPIVEPSVPEPMTETPKQKSKAWLIVTILFFIGGGASYYYITHHRLPSNRIFQVVIGEPTPEQIADSIRQAEIDSIKSEIVTEPVVPAYVPLDTLKYDGKRFLTQISRQYYGNKYFWVYIYEENKEAITDFNNIKRGATLIIPAAEKYGINAKDTSSLNQAKAIGSKLVLERAERMKQKE